MNSVHKTVLLNEAIDGLNLGGKALVIDGTFGGGGHTREIIRRFPNIKVIAIDQDRGAWEKAQSKFEGLHCDITFVNNNFRNISKVCSGGVDAVLLDLGLSSDQLDNSGRGFSFLKDEPLLMTMKEDVTEEDTTALDVVNVWSEESLADIIFGYGEERYARRIAHAIVLARKSRKLATTYDLVEIIAGAVPKSYQRGRLHFATRTFQAIRIAVNDELGALEEGLAGGWSVLNKGGRLAVISFHSLEDRIVKKFFKEKEKLKEGNLVNKKIILAGEEEIRSNPRSRSAKLRIIERI